MNDELYTVNELIEQLSDLVKQGHGDAKVLVANFAETDNTEDGESWGCYYYPLNIYWEDIKHDDVGYVNLDCCPYVY